MIVYYLWEIIVHFVNQAHITVKNKILMMIQKSILVQQDIKKTIINAQKYSFQTVSDFQHQHHHVIFVNRIMN